MTENKQMIVNIIKFIVDNVLVSSICFYLFIYFALVVLTVLPADYFVYLCILLVPINFIFTRVVLCLCSIDVNEIAKYIKKYKVFILLFLLIDIFLFVLVSKIAFFYPFSISFITPILIVYVFIHKINFNIREKFYKIAISLFVFSICIFISLYILMKMDDFYPFYSYMKRNISILPCVVLLISVCITFIEKSLIKWLNLYFRLPNFNVEEKKYKIVLYFFSKISIYYYITFTVYCCVENIVM